MANKTLSMLQIRRILQLLDNGASQRQVNREVGISRNTVQEYHSKALVSGKSFRQLLELDDHELHRIFFEERTSDTRDPRYQILAPRLARYHKELGRTGVTRLLLWQEYRREVDNPYSYQQFCFHLSNHLRPIDSQADLHDEHDRRIPSSGAEDYKDKGRVSFRHGLAQTDLPCIHQHPKEVDTSFTELEYHHLTIGDLV